MAVLSGHFSAPLGRFDWIDGERWRIVTGFRYYLSADEAGEFVDVPDGFVTNFASVPRPLWALLPPTGKYAQIAVVHDKLFLAPVIRLSNGARPCRFSETPKIFVDGAQVLGVSWPVRRVMYRMLQAFSHPAWEHYRSLDRQVGSTIAVATATPPDLVQFEALAVADRLAEP